MSELPVTKFLEAMERLASAFSQLAAQLSVSKRPCSPEGLLTYEDVAAKLGSVDKPISRRQAERVQRRYPSILPKIPTGRRGVRFRQADVDRLISHLAGESSGVGKVGRRRL